MRKSRKSYSEEERYRLLREYYESGMSKRSFCRSHGIRSMKTLLTWISRWPESDKSVSLPSDKETEDMSNRSKESYRDDYIQLRKYVRELEKALSISKLETEVRDMMITRAEEQYGIPIRKKSGAK